MLSTQQKERKGELGDGAGERKRENKREEERERVPFVRITVLHTLMLDLGYYLLPPTGSIWIKQVISTVLPS